MHLRPPGHQRRVQLPVQPREHGLQPARLQRTLRLNPLCQQPAAGHVNHKWEFVSQEMTS